MQRCMKKDGCEVDESWIRKRRERERGGSEGGGEKTSEKVREYGAGGKETLLVRQRKISGVHGEGVVSVISTTLFCPAIPSCAGGNT